MTRLTENDLTGLIEGLDGYDQELRKKSGLSLLGLAARAVGLTEDEATSKIRGKKVGALSLSTGGGVIQGFTQCLAAIASHLGFDTLAPTSTDALGLAELIIWRTDLILAADDHFYGAYNLNNGRVVDNSEATGLGYAVALDAMAGGLAGREVLIMGCGPVGRRAACTCRKMGALISLYDIDRGKAGKAEQAAGMPDIGGRVVSDPVKSGVRYKLIVEATPAADVIGSDFVSGETYVAAPGVPLGVTPEALAVLGNRIVHDPLQIGTAVMLLKALCL